MSAALLQSAGWMLAADTMGWLVGPVKVVLTGNGANLDVRRTIAALPETDLFIDARKPAHLFAGILRLSSNRMRQLLLTDLPSLLQRSSC